MAKIVAILCMLGFLSSSCIRPDLMLKAPDITKDALIEKFENYHRLKIKISEGKKIKLKGNFSFNSLAIRSFRIYSLLGIITYKMLLIAVKVV